MLAQQLLGVFDVHSHTRSGEGGGGGVKTKAKGHRTDSSVFFREGMHMIFTARTVSAHADFCI